MAYKIPVSVLVVIYSADGQFLLLERAVNPGYWQSVTGSQEIGESLSATARRELQEETGLEVEASASIADFAGTPLPLCTLIDHQQSIDYDILSLWRHRYAPGVTTNQEHWFSLKLPQVQRVALAANEHRNQGWFSPWEAIQKCFSPSNQAFIAHLQSREFVTKLA